MHMYMYLHIYMTGYKDINGTGYDFNLTHFSSISSKKVKLFLAYIKNEDNLDLKSMN